MDDAKDPRGKANQLVAILEEFRSKLRDLKKSHWQEIEKLNQEIIKERLKKTLQEIQKL